MATITTNSALVQFNNISQLHIVRQVGLMILLAASIALGIAIVLWSTGSDYVALYPNLPNQESADVVATLDQNGTPYKIDSRSGNILVPADTVQQIRIQLASEGLPKSSSRGYDILQEEQSLGTSNFIEQARYHRALEQELVQTIKHIQGIRDARVHLSIPKQTSFIRNSNKPSGSVMLDLTGSQIINDAQLSGIVHLVASSVAGMEAEQVSIVDQRGNLLSRKGNSDFSSSSENIRFTRELEHDYSERIIDILTPIVGPNNVKAQVSADLDFTFIETTEETYDPTTTVIRSEQIQEEISGTLNNNIAAEPGSLSPNIPAEASDQAATGNLNQSRTNSTRNYEIDHSVSLIRSVPGTINQISVAVLVNLNSLSTPTEGIDGEEAQAPIATTPEEDQARIDRLTQLVKDTIGFNAARGDSVSIINETFMPIAELPPALALPIWKETWVHSSARYAGAGLVIILLIFGVLRPAMKSVVVQSNSLSSRDNVLLSHSDVPELNDDQVSLSGTAALPSAQPSRSVYDENLQLAKTLVQNEPAKAARMIQNWLSDD